MTNKDYFEFYWGKYMSYEDFTNSILNHVRPIELLKKIPMSNQAFHQWKRKVQSEHTSLSETHE